MKTCADCLLQFYRLHGRGLCAKCYKRRKRAGTLPGQPRVTTPREVILEEWPLLRAEGYTVPQAAARLGITPEAMFQALTRARRAGDPRAVFNWKGCTAARREARMAS